ncbi:MAG: bifunctional 5,10-methylenetetrahydrofolate dehydrogenase/5,10-methenyltetrahydrofolate cyclohydrolase [Spirochaetales bacterium]|nr:bifunctional 5,10-methylenetetrahydrofolate dehydrogenase/5,10-methenyltetrahydrofolate cyclohydrolase [Spirochaetales bacterium]MBR6061105.1 bifunctional 5,10-methylenetetrahydrofolate dehydrogenase/5,10-methenyltetrahydrofolate cyclohydrolase [Spirochaetales bacterium]
MAGQIIKLTDFAAQMTAHLKSIIDDNKMKLSISSIMVGENEASKSYFNGIRKKAADFGIDAKCEILPADTTEEQLLEQIKRLNADPSCYGIMMQMPLPKHINAKNVFDRINYCKDIDGMNIVNQGYLFSGEPLLIPATAWAVQLFLEYFSARFDYPLTGKTVTIIGRSNTVGKPAAHLLLQKDMTVNICHSKTVNAEEICRQSDVVVAACGVPKMVKASWLKPGAVVADVGIHRTDDGKLCGDVDADDAVQNASYITAVPGGIGSLTSTLLLANAVKAYFLIEKQQLMKMDFAEMK